MKNLSLAAKMKAHANELNARNGYQYKTFEEVRDLKCDLRDCEFMRKAPEQWLFVDYGTGTWYPTYSPAFVNDEDERDEALEEMKYEVELADAEIQAEPYDEEDNDY